MVPRERKKATLHEKLQLLRSVTNSPAVSKTSIIVDASKYIEELKEKVDRLNQDIINDQPAASMDSLSFEVKVQTLEKVFLITVFTKKSYAGLLVSILEAFEELGLNILQARVSCADTFRLEAVAGERQDVMVNIDSHVVKQAVLQAIKNCNAQNNQ